jgi:PAS domain S-box-containing protein
LQENSEQIANKVRALEVETLRQKRLLTRLEGLTNLKEKLIFPFSQEEKVNLIVREIVRIFDADFARIWLVGPGDRCEKGCFHAQAPIGPHYCADKTQCLHLVSSSGRYTNLEGRHARVPFGAYKIGLIGSGALPDFFTNEVTTDPRVHNHEWAKELGLQSFYGHRLLSDDGQVSGVLAVFSRHKIPPEEFALLRSLAATAAQAINASFTEKALRESEARLRNVFDNMQDCFYRTDLKGRITWASPSTPRLLGYEMEEVLHQDIKNLFYFRPADREKFLAKLNVTGKVTDVEVKLKHKDGSPIWVSTNSAYYKDAKGAVAGVEGSFRDVSQRKRRMEEIARHQDHLEEMVEERTRALVESEQKYRALFENSGNAIFVLTKDSVVDCNVKAAEVFRVPQEDLINQHPLAYSTPTQPGGEDSFMLGEKLLARAFEGEELFLEWRYQRPDGSIFDSEVILNPVSIGGVPFIIGTVADITERKRAEAQRSMLIKILESTSDMVSFSTPDMQITYINPAGRRIIGLDKGDEFPLVKDVMTPEAFDIISREGAPAAVEHGHWSGETALAVKDGTEIPVSQVIMSHKDAEGRVENFSTIIRDISGPKKTEEELERLRDFLSAVIDSMPSVLVGLDEQGRITRWNTKTEELLGKTSAQVRGRLLSEVFPHNPDILKMVDEAIENEKVSEQLKAPIQFQGMLRFWDVTVYPLSESAMKGAVIRVDDVTERVRLEEMMIQSEKMLSVGGLAAGMAHEINNPLAGIIQNVQVLEKRLGTGLSKNHNVAEEAGTSMDAIARYLEKRDLLRVMQAIRESGGRAAAIVNNMLDFSRKGDSAFLPQDLCQMMDQTIELASSDFDLKKRYDFRQIKIQKDYQDCMPKIRCEKTKVQQVILNLLQNAAQAMSGQRDDDNPPEIAIRIFFKDDKACIEVEDNGPGMDESIRKRVFEPFFTTKEIGVGTGLGLSVSYFIVTENHNGTMHVESAPGKGAKFTICLPVEKI